MNATMEIYSNEIKSRIKTEKWELLETNSISNSIKCKNKNYKRREAEIMIIYRPQVVQFFINHETLKLDYSM